MCGLSLMPPREPIAYIYCVEIVRCWYLSPYVPACDYSMRYRDIPSLTLGGEVYKTYSFRAQAPIASFKHPTMECFHVLIYFNILQLFKH